jgi:hypothetical protein
LYLKSSGNILSQVVLEMFILCYRELMDMLAIAGVLGHELFRVGGHGTVHMLSLLLMCTILVFINTSADPPEEKNSPNLF